MEGGILIGGAHHKSRPTAFENNCRGGPLLNGESHGPYNDLQNVIVFNVGVNSYDDRITNFKDVESLLASTYTRVGRSLSSAQKMAQRNVR